jgi:hypothetical protein
MNECDNCGKRTKEELYTREGFSTTYYVEWVCAKCFKKLEGCSFEDYGKREDDSEEISA